MAGTDERSDAGELVVDREPEKPDPDPPVVDRKDGSTPDEDAGSSEQVLPETPPLALTACPDEDAAVCPASDPLCYWESGPGGGGGGGPGGVYSVFTGWSVCTRFCETDADCPSALGTASCVESGSDHICLFECSFGRACPGEELTCSNGDRCGNHFCECTGQGCDDPFCTLE